MLDVDHCHVAIRLSSDAPITSYCSLHVKRNVPTELQSRSLDVGQHTTSSYAGTAKCNEVLIFANLTSVMQIAAGHMS